jgi:hypothetical protein
MNLKLSKINLMYMLKFCLINLIVPQRKATSTTTRGTVRTHKIYIIIYNK